MKKEYQDEIDEYLLKRMSPDDCVAFEKVVAENQELQEQLSFTEEVRHAMRSRNEKLAKMKEWDKETYSKPRLSNRRFYYWASGIAALFIIGVITISTYLSSDVKTMSADYAQLDTICNKKVEDGYVIIESLLAENEYGKALEQIEKEIKATENKEIENLELLAVADSAADYPEVAEEGSAPDNYVLVNNESYSTNHKDDAEDDIDKIDNTCVEIRGEFAHLYWLKARALIGLNRMDEAIQLLDELRKSRSEYESQADSLYKSLKR